jgi:hypothetical protein
MTLLRMVRQNRQSRRRGLKNFQESAGSPRAVILQANAESESPEELMQFLAQTPILQLDGARPIDLTLGLFEQT